MHRVTSLHASYMHMHPLCTCIPYAHMRMHPYAHCLDDGALVPCTLCLCACTPMRTVSMIVRSYPAKLAQQHHVLDIGDACAYVMHVHM